MHAVRTPAGARIWGFASGAIDVDRIRDSIAEFAQAAALPYQPGQQPDQLGHILAAPYRLAFRLAWEPAPALCLHVTPLEAEHRDTLDAVKGWLSKLDVLLPYACAFDVTVLFCQDSPPAEDVEEMLGSEMLAHSLVLGGRAYLASPDRPARTRYLFYPQTRRLSDELIDSLLSAVIWIEASGTRLNAITHAYGELDQRLARAMAELVDMGRGLASAGQMPTARLAEAHTQVLSLYASWQHDHDRLLAIQSELTRVGASWLEEPAKGARAMTQLVRGPLQHLLNGDARRERSLEALRQWLADTRAQATLNASVQHGETLRWLAGIGLGIVLLFAVYVLVIILT